ncbi:MAG: hypothetical protein CM1200mP15_19260 [Dehalococcoidia bacterium]|nr:MAG: hypothetical protein CM1200mP15_19260 [Dehalococcoidia bacterium]
MSKNKINIGNVEMVSVSDGNGDREPTFVFPTARLKYGNQNFQHSR